MRAFLTRIPILTALVAQVVATLVVMWVLAPAFPEFGYGWLLIHGAIAGGLTVAVLRSPWWWPIQLAVPWCLLLGFRSDLPPWMWLTALLLTFVVFGGGIVTRVPLYLSNRSAWEALATLAGPTCRAVDLGAGFGGPMRALARARPGGRFLSVEASPVTALICALLALWYPRVQVRWRSIWSQPLADMDLAYAFLSPVPMAQLWQKAKAEMAPGSLLVSNTFEIPGVKPERIIPLEGRADARLFVYRL